MGKEILSWRQIKFLEVARNERNLTETVYLTGGTALAAFYLNHRESEDLDFFSEEEIEPLAVETFLKSRKKELEFETYEFQRSFNRNLFFLHYPESLLKTEFTYFPFPRIEAGLKEGLLRIDSLRDIAVNKVFTIAQKPRARDFIDLYFIMKRKDWRILDLAREARAKFDARIDMIQFGAQLMKVTELKDMPRMIVDFDEEEYLEYFTDQAANLKESILT